MSFQLEGGYGSEIHRDLVRRGYIKPFLISDFISRISDLGSGMIALSNLGGHKIPF